MIVHADIPLWQTKGGRSKTLPSTETGSAPPKVHELWWYLVSRLVIGDKDLRLFLYVAQKTFSARRFRPLRVVLLHRYWHLIDLQEQTCEHSESVSSAQGASLDPQRFSFAVDACQSEEVGGGIRLALRLPRGRLSLTLRPLTPLLALFPRAHTGLRPVPLTEGWAYPRLEVTGHLSDARAHHSEPVRGSAWFDRGWTVAHPINMGVPHEWVIVHFDDGAAMMLAMCPWEYAEGFRGSYIDPAGRTTWLASDDIQWVPLEYWKSPATRVCYPIAWRFSSQTVGMEWTAHAWFADQELRGGGSFALRAWLGASALQGTQHGQPITGQAYIGVLRRQHVLRRALLSALDASLRLL